MKQHKKALSFAAALAVLFIMLIFSYFIAAETVHDCTGEDCPICQQLSLCEEATRKSAPVFCAALLFTAFAAFCLNLSVKERLFVHTTLITLKVKLSD